jgi:hypothetical protein
MNQNEQKELAEALSAADEPMIREIIREAESFLEAQLKVGLASDQRAMTFAGILAAITSVLVGGTASMVAAKIAIWPHILAVVGLGMGLFPGLIFALMAARATEFYYSGNNPRLWKTDVEKKQSLIRSLSGQAALYAKGIAENIRILDDNHLNLRRAQLSVSLGIAVGAIAEFVIILTLLSRGW